MDGLKVKYAGLVALALALGVAMETAQAANLDKGLLREAGPILDALAEKGVKTVGVLPFQVKKGARQAGFNAAPLATGLPGRLENALIVSQSSSELKAIGVIRDALTAANKAKVGSWMTSRGAFAKLFTTSYPLAWGTAKKQPDGFLTGEVINSTTDRYNTLVIVRLITPKSWVGGKVVGEKVHEFKVGTDRSLLRDLGYAYALPRSLVKKKGVTSRDLDTQAVQQVSKDEQGQKQPPTSPAVQQQTAHTPDNFAGFRFEIEYDKVKQTIEARTGGSQAQQPGFRVNAANPGQEVWMYLTRTAADDGKLGAVLKVNGRSVFEEQETESIGCKKWIFDLSSKDKRWDFGGFYSKGEAGRLSMKKFTVLTPEESEVKASELGTKAGWIDIDIFASGGTGPGPQPQPEDELMISTRGAVKARSTTLKALQTRIAKANNLKLVKSKFKARGGLIYMESEAQDADPYQSDELPNPRRVGGVTIQYWERAGGKVLD